MEIQIIKDDASIRCSNCNGHGPECDPVGAWIYCDIVNGTLFSDAGLHVTGEELLGCSAFQRRFCKNCGGELLEDDGKCIECKHKQD